MKLRLMYAKLMRATKVDKMKKTFREDFLRLLIKVGWAFRDLGKNIQPNYWKCCNCGYIKFKEEEVGCWNCKYGEMIYKG